jgi:two-component system sensor histidine kinase UhpB
MTEPLNILLVEDNAAEAALMIDELKDSRFGPFAVTHVKRLADALDRLHNAPAFDAVLVDLGLPDSQGLTTLERLHNQTPRAVPIVVLTGLDDEQTRLRALQCGAEDYLGKDESAASMRARAIRYAIERKRARAAVALAEQRLGMAIDSAKMGVFDWDIETGHINWSFHHARLFGFAPQEFDGTLEAIEQRVHPDDQSRRLDAIRQSIKSRGEYQCEYRVLWPDASEHWIEARGSVLSDSTGGAARMVGTVMDVTARKAAEEAAAVRAVESARLSGARLTARELEMLRLVSFGLPNKRIAVQLKISIRTVAKHRSNLMAKTKALNAADLARMSALAGVSPQMKTI